MKKGISIWSFAGADVKENLKLAKEAGFEGVELALDETITFGSFEIKTFLLHLRE